MKKPQPQPKKSSKLKLQNKPTSSARANKTTKKNGLTSSQVRSFRNAVYKYFNKNKRAFPWRTTKNPYHILVSEIMLQQTQAGRVVEKYKAFIRLFPTPKHLARAPLHKVLKAWQGLGYNRRAQTLRETAMIVQEKYRGKIPADPAVLATLPGIGPYTAAAIMVFAFNKTLPMIETNVRSVFIHHFFKRAKNVSDTKLIPLIEQTIDNNNPRQWFSALMDYGTHLKTIHPNPSRQSAHYTKQSRFEGSHRQLRGAILITLLKKPLLTKMQLSKLIQSKTNTLEQALKELRGEGIINKKGARFVIT